MDLAQGGPATALGVPSIDVAAVLPLLIVFTAGAVGVLLEAVLPRNQRWPAQVALSLTSVVGAGVALAVYVTGDFESTTTFRAEEASSEIGRASCRERGTKSVGPAPGKRKPVTERRVPEISAEGRCMARVLICV